ncbi:hypothetical protein BJV78DRAFT_212806 [Lactifluus subvellereus]|nr:hypothetical protein BJV78DRAFT_212806 [Lactifluus subvellereus]
MEVSAHMHLLVGPNTRGSTGNGRHSHIHTLDDDVLVNIFYLCRLGVRDEYDDDDGVFWVDWGLQRWWYKLVQVCQRWRYLILASPSHLDLHLVCTFGTPIVDMLANSPPLPLIINYMGTSRETTTEDEEGILLALQHRDRVRRIGLWIPASNLRNLIVAIDEQYPILDHLFIRAWSEDNGSLILPKTFQAPHLCELRLFSTALPIQSPLLTTTVGLVTLTLRDIQLSAYFPPGYLLTRLLLMPQLEALTIGFRSPLPGRDVERQLLDIPIATHVTLSNLRWFGFRGVGAYLEGLLTRISTPVLGNLEIVVFNQPTFTIPHLLPFMRTSENPNLSIVRLSFYRDAIVLRAGHHVQGPLNPLYLEVLCRHLDWQIASTVQILRALSPGLSTVEQLTLSYEEHSLSSEWHHEVDRTQWRELLRPLSSVKTLHIQNELVGKLSRSLQSDNGELSLEILPNLKELGYSEGGDAGDVFTPFVKERKAAGCPVSLVMVDRLRFLP